MTLKKFLQAHRFELIVVVLVLVSSLYVAFAPANNLMNWYSTDDAFYYFKTAQNVTEGHGLTFDGIGRSSGFHPLWMLVCIPVFFLARFDLMLPLRVLVIVAGLFNAGTGILLYRLARKIISEPAAIVMAFLWLLSPSIQGVTSRLGMESTISAFFIVLLFYTVSGFQAADSADWKTRIRQLLPVGLVAALTILSRLDNIFLVGMAGLWLVFKRTRLNHLLVADMALFYVAPIYAAFWRLKPGAEYYQYSTAVYVLIAISMLAKPVLFEFLGVYRNRGGKNPLLLALRVAASLMLADGLAYGVLTVLQMTGRIGGFPRMIPVADMVISAIFMLIVHGLDWFSHRHDRDAGTASSLINWKEWLPEGVGYALPIGLLMGCYFVFNFFYFGTPSPVSGQIKQWWGSLPNTVYGRPNEVWEGLIGFPEKELGPWNLLISIINTRIEGAAEATGKTVFDDPYQTQMVFSWALVGLVAAGLLIVYRKQLGKSTMGLLIPVSFAGSMCQITSYMGTSYVNTRPWYWVQEMVLLVLCGGLLFDAFLAFLVKLKMPRNVQQTMVVCLSLFLFYVYAADLISFVPYYVKPGRENLYLAGVVAVEKETPPGAKIGSTGGGVVAYFIKDRTIINLDGLMNSTEYFHLLKEGNANQYMDTIGMQYLHGNKYMITNSDPYMGLFKNRVEFIKDVWGSGLYRYLPGK
jgi:hypothetical protein